MDTLIAGKYLIKEQLGFGSFGEVFEAVNTQTDVQVAIKIEKPSNKASQVLHEARLLRLLEGKTGIPHVYWYGTEQGRNIMVMTLLGKSLSALMRETQEECLNMKLVVQLGLQMLARVELLHTNSIIHRDIKPENFVIGHSTKENKLYVIDFGLAKKYRDPNTHQHIPYKENKHLVGTARYASLNSHLGIEQSRRDDIECVIYSLIFLARGHLPWQGKHAASKQRKYDLIQEIKSSLTPAKICKGCPPEFSQILIHSRTLRFEDKPDYQLLIRLLTEVAERNEFNLNDPLNFVEASSDRDSEQQAALEEEKLEEHGTGPMNLRLIPSSLHVVGTSDLPNSPSLSSNATKECSNSKWPEIGSSLRKKLQTTQISGEGATGSRTNCHIF